MKGRKGKPDAAEKSALRTFLQGKGAKKVTIDAMLDDPNRSREDLAIHLIAWTRSLPKGSL